MLNEIVEIFAQLCLIMFFLTIIVILLSIILNTIDNFIKFQKKKKMQDDYIKESLEQLNTIKIDKE